MSPYRTRAVVLSLAAHALLVAVLFAVPTAEGPPRSDLRGTEVNLTLGIASLADTPRPAGRLPGPAEASEPPPFPVQVVEPPLPTNVGGTSKTVLDGAPGIPVAPGAASGPAGESGSRGLLSVPSSARSVVYLLDCSSSMRLENALAVGRSEVLASLSRLPAGTLFQVIPFHLVPEPLILDGRCALAPLRPDTLVQARRALDDLQPHGSTKQGRALQAGLTLRPDVLFLLTDVDDLSPGDLRAVTLFNQQRTAIHTVELSRRLHTPRESPLRCLAADNRGSYVHIVLGE